LITLKKVVMTFLITFSIVQYIILFSAPLDDLLERYRESYFEGRRFLIDISKNETVRYENVVKEGDDKLVMVIAPEKLAWLALDDRFYIQNDNSLVELEFPIMDLEDYLMDILESGEYQLLYIKQENSSDIYVIKSGPQTFAIWVNSKGLITKIVREMSTGYRTALIYEHIRLKENGGTVKRYFEEHPVTGKVVTTLTPILSKIPRFFAWSELDFVTSDNMSVPVIYGITYDGAKVAIIDMDGVSEETVNRVIRRFSSMETSFYTKKTEETTFLFVGQVEEEYLIQLAEKLLSD